MARHLNPEQEVALLRGFSKFPKIYNTQLPLTRGHLAHFIYGPYVYLPVSERETRPMYAVVVVVVAVYVSVGLLSELLLTVLTTMLKPPVTTGLLHSTSGSRQRLARGSAIGKTCCADVENSCPLGNVFLWKGLFVIVSGLLPQWLTNSYFYCLCIVSSWME